MLSNASPFPQPISEEIWDRKYKLVTPNEDIKNDESVQDTWARIAAACANSPITSDNEIDPSAHAEKWLPEFYSALEDFKFLPAGRVTAGAGSGREVTLFNCYVMGTIPDDLAGIFDMLKEAALTMQQGGGIGYDFSTIRPSGAPVKGVDADASGPLSFMDVWDAMCRTIMSAGARRGAMMATIRDDHPDVLKFIKAKREVGRLNMFNMSVLCSDAFMKAVDNDDYWYLKHEVKPATETFVAVMDMEDGGRTKQVSSVNGKYIYEKVLARDLWDEIMENTYNHAEPGVLFVDRINKMNNLWFIEDIASTNPCGEQPLPPYGACLLGSINLSRMVTQPFGEESTINYPEIARVTRLAVRMLDSVIDTSNFPLESQRLEALHKRRMGLGITGLADMLLMLGIAYGSKEAQEVSAQVMKTITLTAYWESIQMAREFGPCPALKSFEDRAKFVNSGFMQQDDIPSNMRDEIMSVGIRNALLTSIAPTGTISMYAGNVSSGVEPIFAPEYMRKVLEDDGVTKVEQKVSDYAILKWREYCDMNRMDVQDPPTLVTAQTLTPEDHLIMQAAVQTWIDSSISKTINCPKEISFEDFKAVYLRAYELGLKGCTTYRPNDTLGSVIEIIEEKTNEEIQDELYMAEQGPADSPSEPWEASLAIPERTKILNGQTYKLKWEGKNFYVTINNAMIDGKLAPFEIFINTQDMSNFQWITALTRMMSSVFRRGGDISFVVEDFKSIMDPNGGAWVDGKYQDSFIAYLGRTVALHIDSLDGTAPAHEDVYDIIEEETGIVEGSRPDKCPECGERAMVNRGGCPVCDDCGYSKCG